MTKATTPALLALACLLAMPSLAQARYSDGMNLYQYCRSSPDSCLDSQGQASSTSQASSEPAECTFCSVIHVDIRSEKTEGFIDGWPAFGHILTVLIEYEYLYSIVDIPDPDCRLVWGEKSNRLAQVYVDAGARGNAWWDSYSAMPEFEMFRPWNERRKSPGKHVVILEDFPSIPQLSLSKRDLSFAISVLGALYSVNGAAPGSYSHVFGHQTLQSTPQGVAGFKPVHWDFAQGLSAEDYASWSQWFKQKYE